MPSENPLLRLVLFDEKQDRRAVVRGLVEVAVGAQSVVAQASTLEDAIRAVADKAANAIVLEVQMSGSRGVEAISALRTAYPGLTIAVCSFRNDHSTRQEATLAGADTYLVKPVGVEGIRSLWALVHAKEQQEIRGAPVPT